MIHSFLLFFVLSSSFFILLNQNQLNVFAVFTLNQNDNEDSDSVTKIILTKIKYRSDRFSDDIAGQLKNVGNGTCRKYSSNFPIKY